MKESRIKAVLFDLDDTLWSVVPVIVRAEQLMFDWLARHAPAVAASWTMESMRARRMALMKAEPRYAIDLNGLRLAVLEEALRASGDAPLKAQAAMAVFIAARNAVEPFADVEPVLGRLRAAGRLRLGVVTNGSADLAIIGLNHYFDIAVSAHRFGSAKPDPAIFLAACEELELAPAQVVYVGDDPALDVAGAQNAGLQAVWMQRAELQPQRALPDHIVPDGVCATLHELEAWLNERIISESAGKETLGTTPSSAAASRA